MLKFNNKVLNYNSRWLGEVVDLNPLNLPRRTIRVQLRPGTTWIYETSVTMPETPITDGLATIETVDAVNLIYDVYYDDPIWYRLLYGQPVKRVLGGNTTEVTSMEGTFGYTNIEESVLFDTSNVTNLSGAFSYCHFVEFPMFNTHNVTEFDSLCDQGWNLKHVPLLDTSSAVNVDFMFTDCFNVESGALALYNQLSAQGTVTSHEGTFHNCGKDTVTGAAEYEQIPWDWKDRTTE